MERKRTKVLAIIGLLFVAMFATMPSAQALQDLKITDRNLNALQNWGTWTQYRYVGWELLNHGGVSILDAKYQIPIKVGNIIGIKIADNNAKYWGECVSLVKALSKSNVPTTSTDNNHWTKGVNVISSGNVVPGTAVATFFGSGGSYYGHAAIFRGYVYNSNGQKIGILVWDQNFVAPLTVGRHDIKTSGTYVSDADNYYVVQVP